MGAGTAPRRTVEAVDALGHVMASRHVRRDRCHSTSRVPGPLAAEIGIRVPQMQDGRCRAACFAQTKKAFAPWRRRMIHLPAIQKLIERIADDFTSCFQGTDISKAAFRIIQTSDSAAAPDANRAAGVPSALLFRARLSPVSGKPSGRHAVIRYPAQWRRETPSKSSQAVRHVQAASGCWHRCRRHCGARDCCDAT